jgi:hypothetical protein
MDPNGGIGCTKATVYYICGPGNSRHTKVTEFHDEPPSDFRAKIEETKRNILNVDFEENRKAIEEILEQKGEIAPDIVNGALALMENLIFGIAEDRAQIDSLRRLVTELGSKPMIPREDDNNLYSINESDHEDPWQSMVLKIEALQILLDAKESGQFGLRGEVRALGEGDCNEVGMIDGKDGNPMVVKLCDRDKKIELNRKFRSTMRTMETGIGPATGIYRRNKAASKLQDLIIEIGDQREEKSPAWWPVLPEQKVAAKLISPWNMSMWKQFDRDVSPNQLQK